MTEATRGRRWSPPGKSKRGRPKLTWAEAIRGLMGEMELMEEDWNDRGNWRKKMEPTRKKQTR